MLRFYRPEDISRDQALKADFWEVYASVEKLEIDAEDIVSKCQVGGPNETGRRIPRDDYRIRGLGFLGGIA